MRTATKFIITILIIMIFGQSYAQDTATVNFYDQIKKYDLSTLLTTDSILAEDREGAKDKIKRPEVLGFIGDNFQRFQIHFVSIIQNPVNPYEYLAYGKTKVKETICSFQGKITIKQARLYEISEIASYKQGFAICELILYEDKKQPSTGFIKGKLKSNFVIDNKGEFRYDALMLLADGFSNNEFVGTWTSYKNNTSKKCNWGDYRIPESGDLDIGAAEFSVFEKYVKNGWENYKRAWIGDSENPEVKKAREKELERWW